MFDPYASPVQPMAAQGNIAFSAGLRSHMLRVYNLMGLALALSAIIAYATVALSIEGNQLTNLGQALFLSPLKWVVMLAPVGFVLAIGAGLNKFSLQTLGLLFWAYAAINGVSLAVLGLVFAKAELAQAFAVTALTFGSMSLWGYTTKRDLTSLGSFAMMGVFGILIASVVNIFMQSSMLSFIISCVGVVAFTLLTAYDTQKIKEIYFQVGNNADLAKRAAISGALTLYLDFINLFVMMLQLLRGGNDNR